MTTSHVQSFLEQVTNDQRLQEELATAMEAENDRQAVTDLARSKGYEFTPDELWQEIQNRQAALESHRNNGELSEEELEGVAGGESVAVSVSIGFVVVLSMVTAGGKSKW
jgi:predicted ribosomally synthesized peptide with nif11-like leader